MISKQIFHFFISLEDFLITFPISDKPSNPPSNASFGSNLKTSLSKYFKSHFNIGGLETIKSYLPKLNLSTSDLYNFNLELTFRLEAFILHIFKHFLLKSMPVP